MRRMRLQAFPVTMSILLVALVVPMHASSMGSLTTPGPGGTDPFVLSFDENGNGRISINGGPVMSNPGFLGVDPLSGITALYYPLPEAVVPGDAGVSESAGGPVVLSDGLRFENGLFGFAAVMFYFSDNSDGVNALADTGFPSGFPCCVVREVGPEGNNHFDYFPGGNVYHGISDAVPEPSSLLLLGSGVLGAVGLVRRRLWS